jgi:hypothetical protein
MLRTGCADYDYVPTGIGRWDEDSSQKDTDRASVYALEFDTYAILQISVII